jgi:hypothetical protein
VLSWTIVVGGTFALSGTSHPGPRIQNPIVIFLCSSIPPMMPLRALLLCVNYATRGSRAHRVIFVVWHQFSCACNVTSSFVPRVTDGLVA